jgi:hypothetical protein
MDEASGELRYAGKVDTRFTDTSHYPARRLLSLEQKKESVVNPPQGVDGGYSLV